jgi:putative membrane protein
MREMFDSFAGIDAFLAYLAVALLLLGAFLYVYTRITPWDDFGLIRAGNMGASFSLTRAVLGFIAPLASAVQHSANLVDMAIWGAIALATQIVAFVAVKLIMPSITRDIPAGNGAQGFFLGSLSLAVGLLSAACMSF